MLVCSKAIVVAEEEEALVRLFCNAASCLHLLLLFLYCSSFLLPRIFRFVGSFSLLQRTQYEYSSFSEDEEEEEDERYYQVENHIVADIIHEGESLVFLDDYRLHDYQKQDYYPPHHQNHYNYHFQDDETDVCEDERQKEVDQVTYEDNSAEQFTAEESLVSESENDVVKDLIEEEGMATTDADAAVQCSDQIIDRSTSPIPKHLPRRRLISEHDETCDENSYDQDIKEETEFLSREEKILVIPTAKRLGIEEKGDDEEIHGDSCTVGSTSKSSSEWRSSINCTNSVTTEDPFSSSSRRSCPKWESYTVFQKYDEEMLFLDRISAQKLHETESLKSFQVCPRSISDRIVHKFATINKKPPDIRQNPYHELEAAYVAQICLTWEALNWNYVSFHRKKDSRCGFDSGCPAHIAQQFQQFQVLLQRYIENEPYEQGRRPEIYARMRLLAPKLLQVPEYRDSEDDQQKDEGFKSRVTSAAFLMIMEDGIRTFMNFLKADKETPCQKLTSLFKRHRKGSIDPSLLQLMKKVNAKKKTKLKDLRRSHKCLRKRKLKVEEEMEILMAQIDLKVVSRVLRMSDISGEQLHWSEEKMSKVRVLEGKLHRDSSPLFFPAH